MDSMNSKGDFLHMVGGVTKDAFVLFNNTLNTPTNLSLYMNEIA